MQMTPSYTFAESNTDRVHSTQSNLNKRNLVYKNIRKIGDIYNYLDVPMITEVNFESTIQNDFELTKYGFTKV